MRLEISTLLDDSDSSDSDLGRSLVFFHEAVCMQRKNPLIKTEISVKTEKESAPSFPLEMAQDQQSDIFDLTSFDQPNPPAETVFIEDDNASGQVVQLEPEVYFDFFFIIRMKKNNMYILVLNCFLFKNIQTEKKPL